MVSAVYNGIGQNLINGSHSCVYGEVQGGSIQTAFVELVKMSLVIPGKTTMVELGVYIFATIYLLFFSTLNQILITF